ncbi:ATP-dependent DNA helicase [Bacillus sp. MM09(2025)]|uniref:ATP-dependent DNA helicase n=1 Tax=Bacillus sp. MM09(2025) TaxID=3422493 RepID=UPI003D2B1150
MTNVTSYTLDTQILNINRVICRHLDNSDFSSRGAVSQDILSQLRNFVEHLMLKFYANGQDIENEYANITKAIEFVKSQGNLKVLRQFHEYLQIVASHYTLDEENSERLMLKYYEYLLKIKNLMNDKYSLNILENLDKFPLNTDSNLREYYEKIAEKVEHFGMRDGNKSERYYIQKIKPFFINQQVYYEVTFTPANDYASKFDRVIAFTKLDITDNYAAKLTLAQDNIEILGKTMPIMIIVDWEVSIRDCEYKNFTRLIRGFSVSTGYAEQQGISKFLTSGFNLTQLVDFSDSEFLNIKQQVTQRLKKAVFFDDLEHCRKIIKTNAPGSNILRYLLYHMNNKVIKKQQGDSGNPKLSRVFMQYGSIPFDKIPFNSSPLGHNPKLSDLFACIDARERKHEILARLVRNNTEIKGQLFTPIKDIVGFDEIDELIKIYNSNLHEKHYQRSKLVVDSGQLFINGYKEDTLLIIAQLEEFSKNGIENYANSVKAWLDEPNHGVDCDEKKVILTQMFEKSRVALMYGSAGTGKSTLINHISHFFVNKKKLFLAQTNPAVDNLKRRVTAANCDFLTITKFLKRKCVDTDYDLIVIDECSTVNNQDMRDILNKANHKLLLMVGDSYQISSIRFGNWFSVAKEFVPNSSIFELTKPYRSSDKGLLTLWDKVRKMDNTILETIAKRGYSKELDVSIFDPAKADEIILCLNYDGLYGINNINRFLQNSNKNDPVFWGIQQYKIGDPILFNESDRFTPLIYNNMKGRIVGIRILDNDKPSERIQFDIELDIVINSMHTFDLDLELIDSTESGNSVIRFCVNKLKSTDEDDEGSSISIIPFQVAYALSIHKAQGLEYNSVKIVITDEVDELITHNILYTAITRARNKLKIYWTPEVEKKVLSSIQPKNFSKDIQLLKKSVRSSKK